MRINNISFQGIKVAKQQHVTNPQELRSEQNLILKSCSEQLDSLEKSIKELSGQKNDEFEKKISYTDNMFQALSDAFAKIFELDKRDAKDLFEKPSSYSAYANPVNNGLEKIAGYSEELDVLKKEFIYRVNAEKLGQDVDIFGSILFFGPYGNGKTYITKSVAEATGCNVVKIRHTAKSSDEKTMNKIIDIAEIGEERFRKDRTRTIIFIDEVDKLIGQNSTVSKEFEKFIKDCSKKYHCSVFATTNNPLDLSVDMSDPDVFPIKMSIDPPNGENMEEVFKYYLKDISIEGIDYKKIVDAAKEMEEKTGSKYSVGQIKEICMNVYNNNEGKQLTQNDIVMAVLSSSPELTSDMNSKFENDYKKLIEK